MRRTGRVPWSVCVAACLAALLAACSGNGGNTAAEEMPRLPAGKAGEVLGRAIEAAGGWARWREIRGVSFVSTLTIFDPRGEATSETIFLHKQPLHGGPVGRLESIGLREEIVFGYNGRESWMQRGGRPVHEPQEKMFTEFHGVSSTLSFGLPFVLAEFAGLSLEYVGEESDEDRRWQKLRLVYPADFHSPIEWAVLYFDTSSGMLDRVLAQVNAPFLQHPIWLGRWREYRTIGGIRIERVRSFYPADAAGVPIAGLAAEQLIEHVELDRSFPPQWFTPPLPSRGGSLVDSAQGREPKV